jgi:hypothetical protein
MIYDALQKIKSAGFSIRELNGILSVEPGDRLNELQKKWLFEHQPEIVLQLQAIRDRNIAKLVELFQADVKSIKKEEKNV